MAKEVEEGQPAPAVVPGYGEAGKESASMNKAAHEEATRSRAGKPGSSQSSAPTQTVPPAEAPPSSGTTETDVKKSIAETEARERSKP